MNSTTPIHNHEPTQASMPAMPVPEPPELQPVHRHHGWRVALIIIAAIAATIIIVTAISTLGVRSMQTSQHDDMYQIVHSQEAKKAFREDLKNLDPLAFTDQGVIHSYVIDDSTISHNPMGGINVVLYVNGDQELDESITLNRYTTDGPLEGGGSIIAAKLDDLIIANNKKHGINPSSSPSDAAGESDKDLNNPAPSGDGQAGEVTGRNGDGDE